MNGRELLVATRSPDKLREIREILSDSGLDRIIDLREAGVPEHPDEERIEQFDTFEENALAKARHFAARSGIWTLADDSGLCVEALGGAPGVRSKRFAADAGVQGRDTDRANNELLLRLLEGEASGGRSAHYICAIALADPAGDEQVFTGSCEGIVLREPRGTGGFGYDPLFYIPSEDATFGELPWERKNQISHRAAALARLRDALLGRVDGAARGR